jgi:hypothetical protein
MEYLHIADEKKKKKYFTEVKKMTRTIWMTRLHTRCNETYAG